MTELDDGSGLCGACGSGMIPHQSDDSEQTTSERTCAENMWPRPLMMPSWPTTTSYTSVKSIIPSCRTSATPGIIASGSRNSGSNCWVRAAVAVFEPPRINESTQWALSSPAPMHDADVLDVDVPDDDDHCLLEPLDKAGEATDDDEAADEATLDDAVPVASTAMAASSNNAATGAGGSRRSLSDCSAATVRPMLTSDSSITTHGVAKYSTSCTAAASRGTWR